MLENSERIREVKKNKNKFKKTLATDAQFQILSFKESEILSEELFEVRQCFLNNAYAHMCR